MGECTGRRVAPSRRGAFGPTEPGLALGQGQERGARRRVYEKRSTWLRTGAARLGSPLPRGAPLVPRASFLDRSAVPPRFGQGPAGATGRPGPGGGAGQRGGGTAGSLG